MPNNTLIDTAGHPVPGFGTLPATGSGYRSLYLSSTTKVFADFSIRPRANAQQKVDVSVKPVVQKQVKKVSETTKFENAVVN